MLLENIKDNLEQLYDINIGINIDDYLYKDNKPPPNDGGVNIALDPEKDVLELNIHFHPQYLKILEDESFIDKLTGKNIVYYYVFTEEVSHLVYLYWKCGINDISLVDISRLELELQGKIDRYILLMDFFIKQNEGTIPTGMKNLLFDKIPKRFENHRKKIYVTANLFAKEYCSVIEHNFILKKDVSGLLRDARRLYNLNERDKLNHIMSSRVIH
jgi:hypothetical protein